MTDKLDYPQCPNRRCETFPAIWQRTSFENGRITEVYLCMSCGKEFEQVATTLVMLPEELVSLSNHEADTQPIMPLKDHEVQP